MITQPIVSACKVSPALITSALCKDEFVMLVDQSAFISENLAFCI